MASFEEFWDSLDRELADMFPMGWHGLGEAAANECRVLLGRLRHRLETFAADAEWIGPGSVPFSELEGIELERRQDRLSEHLVRLEELLPEWLASASDGTLEAAGATASDLTGFRDDFVYVTTKLAFRYFGPLEGAEGAPPPSTLGPPRMSPPTAAPDPATRAGEVPRETAPTDSVGSAVGTPPSGEETLDLGPRRGGGRRRRGGGGSAGVTSPPPSDSGGSTRRGVSRGSGTEGGTATEPEALEATLSASGPKELDVDAESEIRVRLELTAEAQPLPGARADVTLASADVPISVILTLQGEAVAITDPLIMKVVQPPGPGAPQEVGFGIRGVRPGACTAVVHFQQGTTPLAQLVLSVSVVQSGASDEPQSAEAEAAPPDPRDDQVLSLIIQPPTGENAFYTFLVTSELLGLKLEKFTSPPFELGSRSASEAPVVYAQSVFETIESHILEKWDDARMLSHRLKGLGVDMCRQLFPAELIRQMWDKRDDIDTIEITSFEPYIPWEVVRLKHPGIDGGAGVDDRHLAEYRLVRTLSGRFPQKSLGRKDWRCVLAEYPNRSYDEPTGERDFLMQDLPGRGITVQPINPDPLDVVEQMELGEFDVVHVACHGLASVKDIEASSLILSDRQTRDGIQDVTLMPADIAAGANLMARRPLIFLNACQSGRLGPSLTDLGGWPKTFLGAGAGAMVGTSWSVHEGPAVDFATAFYDTLLAGDTLSEAAGAGRAAIKDKGASWLAYAVYGLPNARMPKAAESE